MKVLWVILGLIVLLLVILGLGYNRMIRLSQGVDSQWAQVQNQYQRRMDLIPNLVKTVEGSANFEKSTLQDVIAARASATQIKIDPNAAPTDPAKLAEFERTQSQLSGALSRLLVTVEKYPDLRSTQGFLTLQTQIEGTENRISVERERFNDAVKLYNVSIQSFPASLYAGMFHFVPKPYFTGAPAAQTPPTVQFDFSGKAPATEK